MRGPCQPREDFAPIGSQDYSVIIDKVVRSGADGMFVVTTGADTITLLKQAGQVNLPGKIRIFGTGFLDDDAAMAVGMNGYVSKPVNVAKVIDELTRVFAEQRR